MSENQKPLMQTVQEFADTLGEPVAYVNDLLARKVITRCQRTGKIFKPAAIEQLSDHFSSPNKSKGKEWLDEDLSEAS